MAGDEREPFSPGFDTARLDSIGPWTADADEEALDISWKSPPALQTGWVPLDVRFYTGTGGGSASLDPDERMFELLEMFGARRDEFVGQLQRLTDREIRDRWMVLGAPDSAAAHRALCTLARHREGVVGATVGDLKPINAPDSSAVNVLCAKLSDADFRSREAATEELIALGIGAVPQIAEFQRGTQSPEARDRAAAILRELDRPARPERLRYARGIELLEYIGDEHARKALEALSKGMPGALVTENARAALRRLDLWKGPN